MPPPARQTLGSQDPFAQRGREPSLLEFLDWMISMGAGIGCAMLLYNYGTPNWRWAPPHAEAWLVLATTVVVGAIDLLNKRTRMRLNLPASPGMVLFGTVFTLALFGGVGALFYYHWDAGALFLLILLFMLATGERRQLRQKVEAARAQQAGAPYPGAPAAAPHSGQTRPTSPIRE